MTIRGNITYKQRDQGLRCLDPQGPCSKSRGWDGRSIENRFSELLRGTVQAGHALPCPLLRW